MKRLLYSTVANVVTIQYIATHEEIARLKAFTSRIEPCDIIRRN
jgi:hypothetical protein